PVVFDDNDAAGDGDFAIGERVKRIHKLVGAHAAGRFDFDLDLFRGKSLTLFTLILPLRAASSIEAMSESVVVVGGISLMITVESSLVLIFARTLIPPAPSLYSRASMRPPVGKSGSSLNGCFFRMAICASSSSGKLWGRILQDMPTAMPSVPSISSSGSFDGSATGSWLRPS